MTFQYMEIKMKELEDKIKILEQEQKIDDILVIRTPYPMKQEAMQRWYDLILKQMELGIVLLPTGFSVALCPKDVEVKFMDSNNDIFKEEKDGT